MATITMSENGPSPNPLTGLSAGSKITWTNAMTVSTDLNYPSCVSPGGSVTLVAGASGAPQTVNKGSHGTYGYSYSYSPGATFDGTIDVS
jgi:plastocyanin